MTNTTNSKAKIIVPAVVVLFGIFAMFAFFKSKPEPKRATLEETALLVRVSKAEFEEHAIFVSAQGQVIPSQQITLQAQVSGQVTWQSSGLHAGGVFAEGEKMLQIDPKDYRFQVEARQADVSKAELEYELEKSRSEIAKKEWGQFTPGANKASMSAREDIALRKPQLKFSQDSLSAAKGTLKKARLDLSRTTIKAPFACMVLSEQVDKGQLLSPQTPIATLVGTETFWVELSVPFSKLEALSLTGIYPVQQFGVSISYRSGQETVRRPGKVIALHGNLDAVGRMARLLVEIEDPLSIKASINKGGMNRPPKPPLLLGTFVEAEIESLMSIKAVKVPRSSIHDGNQIWVRNKDSRLEIRNVKIGWRYEDSVLVESGIEPGEEIIVSQIPAPVSGMKLRIASKDTRPKDSPKNNAGGALSPDKPVIAEPQS